MLPFVTGSNTRGLRILKFFKNMIIAASVVPSGCSVVAGYV